MVYRPVGLTAKNVAAVHIAPKSLIDTMAAFPLSEQGGVFTDLTNEMHKFLHREEYSVNPTRQQLRSDSIEHISVVIPIINNWAHDEKQGVHNDTVWLYYGSYTGMTLIYPPNDWGFLWDPTRRPW